jgi:hypothetical protein
VSTLSRGQVAEVLVDLKRRIQGDFFVVSEDDEKIVFGNRRCPFEDKVIGRPRAVGQLWVVDERELPSRLRGRRRWVYWLPV